MRRFLPSAPARFAARFARATRGVTAVEFALVSLPLLTLIMGTLELALVMLVTITLETASEIASRTIRTGEFQTSGASTRANFNTRVCSNMSWLSGPCATNLTVTSQVFPTFAALSGSSPLPPGSFVTGSGAFAAGVPCDKVLVRAYYTWRLFTPLLSAWLDNTGGGVRLISTATAFQNEPYTDPPPGAAC